MATHRRYTKEFKREAVRLPGQTERPAAELPEGSEYDATGLISGSRRRR